MDRVGVYNSKFTKNQLEKALMSLYLFKHCRVLFYRSLFICLCWVCCMVSHDNTRVEVRTSIGLRSLLWPFGPGGQT